MPHGESTTKNTCSHVGCTSHWAPATTACRLPWLGARASAKVRPHWVKAKAWWGSRLARQSMRAVVVPPTGARYLSIFLSFSYLYVCPSRTRSRRCNTSARFTFRSRRGGLRICNPGYGCTRTCKGTCLRHEYYRESTYLSNLRRNRNEIMLCKLKIHFYRIPNLVCEGKAGWTTRKETPRDRVELTQSEMAFVDWHEGNWTLAYFFMLRCFVLADVHGNVSISYPVSRGKRFRWSIICTIRCWKFSWVSLSLWRSSWQRNT